MLPVEVVLVLALAAYRATRIVTKDTLTDGWRERLYHWAWVDEGGREGPQPRDAWRTWVLEGITCPLCVGVWAAGVLYLMWRWGGPTLRGLVVVLAIAGAQCVLALIEPDVPDESS